MALCKFKFISASGERISARLSVFPTLTVGQWDRFWVFVGDQKVEAFHRVAHERRKKGKKGGGMSEASKCTYIYFERRCYALTYVCSPGEHLSIEAPVQAANF